MTDKKENDKDTASDLASLELSLEPDWARQAPGSDPYLTQYKGEPSHRSASARDRFTRRDGGGGGGKRPSGPRSDRRSGPSPRGEGASRNSRPPHGGQRGAPDRRRPPHDAPPPRLPIQVSFIPEQERLAALVADIRSSVRAYPLPGVASLFLSQPERHLVKLEVHKEPGGQPTMRLYQVRGTGQVYLDRDECMAHVIDIGLDEAFEKVTVQQDPPAGNFVFVARCRLSGTLLGPPNFHGYNESLETLHRTRFAHMPINDYRRNIETSRDPELIERWKEEWRTSTQYRLKGAEDASAELMSEKEARAYLQEKAAPRQISEVTRVMIPGPQSREISDPRLRDLLRQAWSREDRFPITMIRALRGAFRRMGLHSFDGAGRVPFVTAIQPRPIEQENVVAIVAEILDWLKAHPGCTRQALVLGVRPETESDPGKVAEVSLPLKVLIEKGHVVEYHNGTLSAPREAPPQPKSKKKKPAAPSGA